MPILTKLCELTDADKIMNRAIALKTRTRVNLEIQVEGARCIWHWCWYVL